MELISVRLIKPIGLESCCIIVFADRFRSTLQCIEHNSF